jgi:hypothetical protein
VLDAVRTEAARRDGDREPQAENLFAGPDRELEDLCSLACLYDEPFRQYAYTPAWVARVAREVDTVEKWRAFFGAEPRLKVSTLAATGTSA